MPEEPDPISSQRHGSDDYTSDCNEQPSVTHERIIEKEHLVEITDQSHHTFHIILASLISLFAGLIIGYFAYNRLNLTGVKSVNISAEDVNVIHQVAGSNVEGIASKGVSYDTTSTTAITTDTLSQNPEPVMDGPIGRPSATADIKANDNTVADANRVVTDTVKSNRYLTTMALKHYGKKKFWVYIYEENKEKLTDPDMIPANTVVVIPPASKYGIRPGDPASEADAEKLAVEITKRQH